MCEAPSTLATSRQRHLQRTRIRRASLAGFCSVDVGEQPATWISHPGPAGRPRRHSCSLGSAIRSNLGSSCCSSSGTVSQPAPASRPPCTGVQLLSAAMAEAHSTPAQQQQCSSTQASWHHLATAIYTMLGCQAVLCLGLCTTDPHNSLPHTNVESLRRPPANVMRAVAVGVVLKPCTLTAAGVLKACTRMCSGVVAVPQGLWRGLAGCGRRRKADSDLTPWEQCWASVGRIRRMELLVTLLSHM